MADHNSSQKTQTTICPLCGTRISVREEDEGRKIRCPDCQKVFPITLHKKDLKIPEPVDEDGDDDYGLKASDDDVDAKRAFSASLMEQAERELEEGAHRHELSWKKQSAFDDSPRPKATEPDPSVPRERPTPEDYDPKAKLVKYPLNLSPSQFKQDAEILGDVGMLIRWVFISLASAVALFFIFEAVRATVDDTPSIAMYLYALAMTMVSSIVGVTMFIYLASSFMFIVSAVTSGVDKLEWPETYIFDKAMESLYVALPLFLATLPLALLGSAFEGVGLMVWLGFALAFAAFPILFLSILDSGSLFVPWSSVVVGSIFRLPLKWAMFWGATLVIFLVWAGLIYGLLWWRNWVLGYMAIPVAVLFVGYSFIYALWLGRLGWEISQLDLGLEEDELEDEANTLPKSTSLNSPQED